MRVVESGPLRVAAEIRGRIGAWPFVTARVRRGGPAPDRLPDDVRVPARRAAVRRAGGDNGEQQQRPAQRFRVGEAWETGRDATRSNRRPFYDSSFKLQALFPAKLRRPTLDKNAPFDVCRSTIATRATTRGTRSRTTWS